MNNTEKSNSNIIKQNLKTTKDATTQTETQTGGTPDADLGLLQHPRWRAL